MHILYIDHYAGGPSYGMEYRPFYLAREWVAAGHKVTIVGASESHVRSRRPAITGKYTLETIDGVKYIWCRTPPYSGNGFSRVINIFTFLRRLYDIWRWLPEAPEVVIASSTYPLDIYPARRIARRYNARLVWEVHDLWPLSPIELGGISPAHPFMVLLQKAENDACRSADVIVSILPRADEHLVTHGMDPSKFVHIPNGIDPAEWQVENQRPLPSDLVALFARQRAAGNFLVGYAGAHGVANALWTIVEAASKMRDKNVCFVLVGQGANKAELENRAKALGVPNILFLPAVAKASIPALLEEFDVLYLGLQRQPLFRFGVSPNKLIDYMMAGKPIISAIEAGNDMVSDARCGTSIASEDPLALITAIERLRELTVAERQNLGQSGRRYVLAKHVYSVLSSRFLQVLSTDSSSPRRSANAG